MFFSKQKHETVFFRNYEKFDNSAFREALNRELIKYDLNNIEYDTFQEIIVSLLNVYAPLKKKYLRANHASFVTKDFEKLLCKEQDLETSILNNVNNILRESKRYYFESFDVKFVKGNTKFWKKISPFFFFQTKLNQRKRSHL